MKKSKIVLSVLTAFSIAFTTIGASHYKNLTVFAYNDTTTINTDNYKSEAVEVNYDGTQTLVYGVQSYAGVDGPVWITGDVAAVLEDGTTSHSLGSNASDGRSNLKISFKINSSIEGNAYLGVFVKNDNDNSHAIVKVNDNEGFAINFKELTNADYNQAVEAMIPVTLNKGVNHITITMQENYTAWFGSFFISNESKYVSSLPYNETNTCNTTAPETEAVTIKYDGEQTIVYGIQSYAGLKGPAWIVGDRAEILEDGSTSHSLGSNASDGRSNFEMTFKIDSSVIQDAYLNVYAKIDGEATSNAKLKVNDNEVQDINFFNLNNITWNQAIPTKIPVKLIKGVNIITITLQENYTLWVGSWSVTPANAKPTYSDYSKLSIGMFTEKSGDMGAGGDFVGLNAFDNAIDYGKHGTVTYKFTCEKQGEYYLKMNVMAGNDLANRATITINDEVYSDINKPYISFNTALGWSGDSLNTYKVTLNEGLNTLVIGNYLTTVNEAKTQEVPEGSENSVLVSNWWIHKLSIEKVPNMELLIDTTNAKTIYNTNRSFTSEGLKVTYKEDDKLIELNSDEYVVDSSAFNSSLFGTYTIKVTKKDNADVSTTYLVAVGDNGQPYEGKTISYNGNETGQVYSFYNNAKIEGEGTDECANRIFWYNSNNILADGGFEFGSNGVGEYENRQVTLTLKINSSVAGNYALISEITTNDRDNATLNIKVNDNEAYNASLFYASSNLPYKFIVSLKEGENTIKLTTNNQYNFWFRNFGLAPITSHELNETIHVKEGYRYGMSLIDPESKDIYKTTSANGGISFYYNVIDDGNYAINLKTITAKDKKCDVFVDDTKYDATIINGVSKVYVTLTKGVHRIYVSTTYGVDSDFSMESITLTKDIRVESLVLDTTNANLTIPYDGILDTTTIKVSVKNSDGSEVLITRSEFVIVKDEKFSATKPGTYTFKVVYKENEEIFATFNVIVLEKEENPSVEPSVEPSEESSSEISETPSSSEIENSSTNNTSSNEEKPSENKKGCKGEATTTIGLIALLGTLLLKKKKY